MYDTRNDLSISVREVMIPILQARLIDSVDLYTQVKQAQWNVKGPHFMGLHDLFNSLAEMVEQHSDTLAERIAALGGRADATAGVVAKLSSLGEFPFDVSEGLVYVAVVADKVSLHAKGLRTSIEDAARLGDADTADLFTGISRAVHEQLRLLDSHLQAER
jgi:starvation-inducible DNA-binding protein